MPKTPENKHPRLPDYLKTQLAPLDDSGNKKVKEILNKYSLNTVCEGARCPNKAKCYAMYSATFLIMGKNCTRNCKFCNIVAKSPMQLDFKEPENIAKAIIELELKYAVITSVTRDDLCDYGAGHFAQTILNIKKLRPEVKVEVLTPDFMGNSSSLKTVIEAEPDVFNHNVETVERLCFEARPMANYQRSLGVLASVKKINPSQLTKTGIMVGLGETFDEIFATLEDIKKANVDILTIGQYIQPSRAHLQVQHFYAENDFYFLRVQAEKIGIKTVISAPLARSSYKAFETYQNAVAQNT